MGKDLFEAFTSSWKLTESSDYSFCEFTLWRSVFASWFSSAWIWSFLLSSFWLLPLDTVFLSVIMELCLRIPYYALGFPSYLFHVEPLFFLRERGAMFSVSSPDAWAIWEDSYDICDDCEYLSKFNISYSLMKSMLLVFLCSPFIDIFLEFWLLATGWVCKSLV